METYEDLGAVIGTVEFDAEALIRQAVVAGRRHQRRRRAGAGVGVLVVGALAVGTSLHFAGSPEADGTAVAAPVTTADGRVVLPSAELTDARLVARLPVPGDLVSTTDHPDVDIERTIDPDGAGAGSVSLALSSGAPLTQGQISTTAAKCRAVGQLTGPESCHAVAEGWLFTLASQPDPGSASDQSLDWSATLVAEDGTNVFLRATNFVTKGSPTRQAPVLDLDQIEQLATDPVWFQPAS
jgi:hypothetical protein